MAIVRTYPLRSSKFPGCAIFQLGSWNTGEMAKGYGLLLLLAFAVAGQALRPLSVLTSEDQTKIRAVLEQAKFTDIAHAHYSILGLTLLGAPAPKDACNYLKANIDISNVQSLYHATAAAKALGNCQLNAGNAKQTLNGALNESADTATLFYAVCALNSLNFPINSVEVAKLLKAALQKDDSVISQVYSLHVASMLSAETDVTEYVNSVEDIAAQGDEIDEIYLQFEGGILPSALFIDGALKVAAKANKKPVLTEEQVVMMGNYILSRKSTQNVRNAYLVVLATKALSDNKFFVPVGFTLSSSITVSPVQPKINVQVTNLMAGSVGQLTVSTKSAVRKSDGSKLFAEKKLTAASDKTHFELNFLESKPAPGFYDVTLVAKPAKADSRLIGLSEGSITVKVVTEVAVEGVELLVIDRDQSITTKTVSVQHPKKLASVLEADHHQNIMLKFTLKDKATNKPMAVHQAFIRMANVKTKQEVIFTSDRSETLQYSFKLDVAQSGRDHFSALSGKYSMELIVGDASIQNPFLWHVADLNLKLNEDPNKKAPEVKGIEYKAKDPIDHMFRVPEKRPSKTVSSVFTGLIAIPLIILLALWAKLGVNLGNMPMSLSAIGFHVGLASILGLMYCYWAYLNMFQTVRYLTVIGIVTFICGNRLLGSIAARKG
ncbi:dolichyl-diphosphooligosaccharide--protein glycosyltransferase subunit 2-like isoform X2 [Anneissia japonica]|uniref:dolichyl-diphosphooligosaccharide--protein glycosyltransferase subunit 2-like isoform X2 n=1 Tax=Anneissia japonica TaxID=1529436 RepID=UPI00142581B2|nr:dolichyl-diphosphooligosaccharide--protein glycosyltransferase subunit 2-like isoform X2 [Anneissia japonica]